MSTGLMWNLRLALTNTISLFFVGILALATWKTYSTAVGEVWESHLFPGDVGLVVLWASMLNEPHHMESDKEFSTYNVYKASEMWSKSLDFWVGEMAQWGKPNDLNLNSGTHIVGEKPLLQVSSELRMCVCYMYICAYTSFIFWMKFRITT